MLFSISIIGGLLLALLQKLGFRFIVGLNKVETPGFFKLYLIQILTASLLFLPVYFVIKMVASGRDFTSTFFIPPTLFGISPIAIIISMNLQYLIDIAIYSFIVAILTKALTKKGFLISIKSQIFSIILMLAIPNLVISFSNELILNQIKSKQIGTEQIANPPTNNLNHDKTGFSKYLDEYENMIISFESIAMRDQICESDMMNLTLEMLPQLNSMNVELGKMKNNGSDINQEDITRYLNLIGRYVKATSKMDLKNTDKSC
jgi:hypothetical protein